VIGLLAALAATQLLGWATTFYIPGVLGDSVHEATGLSREVIFGGVTVMYIVGGLAAPWVGPLVDAQGARRMLVLGSAMAAAALVGMAFAGTTLAWILCWTVIGAMMPMALANTAVVAIAQRAAALGRNARRPIGALTLFTGLSISVAFPMGSAFEARLGWRDTCLAFAAINLLVCLPLHLTVPRGVPVARATPAETGPPRVPPAREPWVMALLALAFTLNGFCTVALELHLLTLLGAAGATHAGAVALAALSGPVRVAARLLDMALARRVSALLMGISATALMPAAMLCLMAGGTVGAGAFILLWSVSMGVSTVARAAVPLDLFGAQGFATRLGRLTLPINLGQAFGPVIFAFLLGRHGVPSAAWLALGMSCLALLALAVVAVLVRRPRLA
jgi:predicted MFS family arabinose efflux permease